MSTRDWHVIVPGEGEVRDVAVLLLSLADDPRDVRTQRGGTEFLVAPYVAERFTQPEPKPDPKPKPAPARRTRSKKGDS